MPDPIVVLRRDIHGMPIEEYATAIRDRLPDHEVRLARSPQAERGLIADAPIATGLTLRTDLLAAAENLRLFQCLYAGTDHLPMDAIKERDVTVTSASGVHGPNVAEWVIGMMLTFARGLHHGFRQAERREWRHYQAGELHGSTVTVVGLGSIGTAVADRLGGFGVETIGIRHSPAKGGPTDEVYGFDPPDVHEALSRTDYLVLAAPLTETTEGLIDAEAFETLPPTAVLLNIARGPIVDTDALLDELRSSGIRGAALDVTDPEPLPEEHPLWNFENVLITPHNAGYSPAYYERVADILAANVTRIEETGSYRGLENQVVPGA